MANKKRGKSKSRGNKRFRRKKTIKLNRKYVKRRSRKRRKRKQRGGNALLNIFGFNKKKDEYAAPMQQLNPMQGNNLPQPVKKTNMVMGQIKR